MNIFTSIFDTCFPPRESAKLLLNVHAELWGKQHQPRQWKQCTCLAVYAEPVVKAAIAENKFYANRTATNLLVTLLRQWNEEHGSTVTYFVPVPLSKVRQRSRGHNQVEAVLRVVVPNQQIVSNALVRPIDTPPQTSLTREARAHNMSGAFTCSHTQIKTLPPAAHIVLVDDVITTGATMGAAKAALSPHLLSTQRLTCVAFAH